MATTETPTAADSADLDEQLRAAIDLLHRIAADWRLLDRLTSDDRRRFHQAIARLSEPDPRAKRKRQKAAKAAGVRRDEAVLNQTGIRTLRRRPVVTTPNVFPPQRFEGHDIDHQAPAPTRRPANGEQRTAEPPPAFATSARRPTRASTTSTISSAPHAPISISPRARSSRTCAAVSRCSPAGASRSATRPA